MILQMCQLFLSVRRKNTRSLLQKFLKKSETENLKDGFGISWISETGLWRTYKKPIAAFEDSKIPDIDSKLVLAHLRYIDKNTMTTSEIKEEIGLQNTHPFTYKNWIFAHHGDLFFKVRGKLERFHVCRREPSVQNTISKLYPFISPKHQKLIKGDTDSELLFHLFLSILEDSFTMFVVSPQKSTVQRTSDFWSNLDPNEKRDAMMHSFAKMMDILKKNKIENSSNFILANGDCVLIANVYSNDTTLPLKRVDLFIDDVNGTLISSSKMTDGSKKIKSNSVFII